MDFGIIDYCLQRSPFFDVPSVTEAGDFAKTGEPLPDGWLRTADEIWCYQHPAAQESREQGWKVHVSTTPDDAEKVLDVVWSYCLKQLVPFKFLRSPQQVLARNSKYADRTTSGKFIAIYPRTEGDLAGVLNDLDLLLAGFEGPAILTDLRYRTAPVYVRYGAFVELVGADAHGLPVPSVRRPDGVLVPDVRRPSFYVPDWVTPPECVLEALERRRAGSSPLPFKVQRALHFSNGGGVYDAVERATGARVLVKEARPMAGLDEQGRDAVHRLEQERWALEELAGAPYVPRLVSYLRGDRHYYLARDFVDGDSLLTLVQRHHPDLQGERDLDRAAYADWALTVGDRVAAALHDMHGRGVAFGDVHPNNVLVGATGEPMFIDLETASRTVDDQPQRIGAPGFRAPDHLRGTAADRYGLACLRLALLLPATITLSWGPEKVFDLLEEIHARFDGAVPRTFDEQVLADLGIDTARPARVEVSADDVTAFTLANATPRRDDRLYPSAANLFRTPGGSLTPAYGASGVLWALRRRGNETPAEHLEWLETRLPRLDCGPGLFEGWAGLGLTLADLGLEDSARQALDRALEQAADDTRADHSLTRGRSGAGVAALQAEALVPGAAEAALAIGEHLMATEAWTRMGTRRGTPAWGLLDGPAGPALLFVRLHERFGSPELLTAARAALKTELDLLFPGGGGAEAPVAPGPWRRPTIHRGSAGTAMVLADYLARTEDTELERALARLGTAHDLWHHEQPGLFTGRAGMIAALRHVGARWPGHEQQIARQTELLALHRVTDQGVAGYLGDHGLKMSCDLGTGSTGIVWVTEGGTVPFCFPE
ncbi:class III lanthionine synthetase LanKC [Kineosporia rhizophila]|uniref:class III lanthionine synthetase LanKC n=1 Tax=Kineosporia rhizophila TaxID=84633 RepID=UPI001E35DC88|nr:class III lanthionine synthetase LanKC [Kineosporia rhizophila]MCE0539280.1 class III lanthionine synthetase LanKC [Kineosporia rhizophila]